MIWALDFPAPTTVCFHSRISQELPLLQQWLFGGTELANKGYLLKFFLLPVST